MKHSRIVAIVADANAIISGRPDGNFTHTERESLGKISSVLITCRRYPMKGGHLTDSLGEAIRMMIGITPPPDVSLATAYLPDGM